jgi:hypothetical protein
VFSDLERLSRGLRDQFVASCKSILIPEQRGKDDVDFLETVNQPQKYSRFMCSGDDGLQLFRSMAR